MEKDTYLVMGFVIGIMFFLLVLTMFFWGDKADSIDTRKLGEAMCKEHGLEYSHRTLSGGSPYMPKIYCRNKEKQLEDGYLLLSLE